MLELRARLSGVAAENPRFGGNLRQKDIAHQCTGKSRDVVVKLRLDCIHVQLSKSCFGEVPTNVGSPAAGKLGHSELGRTAVWGCRKKADQLEGLH